MRPALLPVVSSLLIAACAPAPMPQDPATDPNCRAFFDGCNSCVKMPDGTAACTKKYCAPEAMKEPYCTEFDNK